MRSHRRILCLWFPRLSVERLIRRMGGPSSAPMAILRDTGNMQVVSSLNTEAEAKGLRLGQPLRDAMAICPSLVTRLENTQRDGAFLTMLARWAGRFSPWVAQDAPAGLTLDVTGCTHLFGGETAMISEIEQACDTYGLSVQAGMADTVGAAWALARYAGQKADTRRTGDAIDQEARATRSRAAKRRHWERGGAAPKVELAELRQSRIAPHGQTRQALGKLPLPALRLQPDTVTALSRLGLRRIEDVLGMPRATLTRRFGLDLVRRLDQALGLEPEPVSPARAEPVFAVRLTLPDPIGLEEDILAAIDRLLPPLCEKLRSKGRGVRTLRFQAFRSDETSQTIEVGLARPSHDPERMRPLLTLKISELDAGFGIDLIRLHAIATEPVQVLQHSGHAEARARASEGGTALDDLVSRIGARIGLEDIMWMHPASSHAPEKSMMVVAAAWSEPVETWPEASVPRPSVLFAPEPVHAPDTPIPPEHFRWRGRGLRRITATGPERISPEWWLDEPQWRTGVRDYWRVEVAGGERLWLYYAHGAAMSSGWFCHGHFN